MNQRAWIGIAALGAVLGCGGEDSAKGRAGSSGGGAGGVSGASGFGATGGRDVDAASGGDPVVCEGDYFASDLQDLPKLTRCASITGDLTLQQPTLEPLVSVNLSVLTRVDGDLVVYGTELTALKFPVLATVGGNLRMNSNDELTELALPALTTVDGDFILQTGDALTSASVPELASVAGDFYVGSNHALTSFAAGKLASIGDDVQIGDNGALTTLSLPLLTSVAGERFYVDANAMLPACAAQALRDQLVNYTGSVRLEGNDEAATCP
jgi:hypothetical protein